MPKVTIHGASDDLIEIDGAIREEFNPASDGPSYLAFSEGTVLGIQYMKDGIWRVNRIAQGFAHYTKTEGTDSADDYTDRVTLEGDIKWVVFGDRIERVK